MRFPCYLAVVVAGLTLVATALVSASPTPDDIAVQTADHAPSPRTSYSFEEHAYKDVQQFPINGIKYNLY